MAKPKMTAEQQLRHDVTVARLARARRRARLRLALRVRLLHLGRPR